VLNVAKMKQISFIQAAFWVKKLYNRYLKTFDKKKQIERKMAIAMQVISDEDVDIHNKILNILLHNDPDGVEHLKERNLFEEIK